MRLLVFIGILLTALVGCSGQEVSRYVEYFGGPEEFKEIVTYSDGSYRLRLVLYDQQREEEGFFNNNGVWTVRGKVIWYDPQRTNKHTDYIEDGRIAKSTDESRTGISKGCLASLTCG
ncbi:uncharacterized protein [Halyomorpha halys]|uniref:uncharacterized protein n=1 Tax=Halyomorpha halys TaxID=286706 RepID=UPI0034D32194